MARILKTEGGDSKEPKMNGEKAQRVSRWAKGEITWAEVEGLTWEDAKTIAQVGVDLAAAGRLEEARTLFEAMVEMNPRDAAAHGALGTIYQKLARPEDARVQYDAALELNPENPVALANRGELRLRLGDSGGREDLSRAIAADPEGQTSAGRRASAIARALALVAAESAA